MRCRPVWCHGPTGIPTYVRDDDVLKGIRKRGRANTARTEGRLDGGPRA
jgi:hypothetical protein